MHRLLSGSLRTEKLKVKITGLPTSLSGICLVQLSDLHYDGLRLSEEMLLQAIAICNEIKPDLVVLTGDYVTDDPTPIHKLASKLKHLQSQAGIYAVLGNHDIYYKRSKVEVTDALTKVGINVLWNQVAYPFGKELPIVGLADFWSSEFDPGSALKQLSDRTPRIVLSHNPDTAHILQQWRVDLQLSGHTHGGQFVLPGIGPLVVYYKKLVWNLPKKLRSRWPFLRADCIKVVKHWEWSQGFHRVGNNQLYVNRGLGTYPPGRLFCPPEITVITLENEDLDLKINELELIDYEVEVVNQKLEVRS